MSAHASSEDDRTPPEIDRVAVVGAGTMGHGIAIAFAVAGHPVSLFDADEAVLARASDRVDAVLETFVEHGRIDADDAVATRRRIEYDPAIESCVDGADFVTEAVTEERAVKRAVFEDLSSDAPARAILATNTSGLSITAIAEGVERPERVVGTHWFNPPYVVPLVEVVPGEETADATVERTAALLERAGKTAVALESELPGFIANRIQLAMSYEACSLLDRGVASAEAIDRAVKASFGFRLPILGVFEKIDHSGIDVEHEVQSYLLSDLDRATEPSDVLTRLRAAGHFGIKTGRGVYDWSDLDPESVFERRDRALLDQLAVYESAMDSDDPGSGEG